MTEQEHWGLRKVVQPLSTEFDTILSDMDGVCFAGTSQIPYVADSIAAARQAGATFVFVTNNATRPPAEAAEKLESVGISATADDVYTSAIATISYLTKEFPAGTKLLVIGTDGFKDMVAKAGYAVVSSSDDKPDAVVQAFSYDVNWTQLAEATYAINDGARFIATNLDRTLPTERGFSPGNGSLVTAVQHATGVRPISLGKPTPGLFAEAAQRVNGSKVLCIGDRLDTDIAGTKAAGFVAFHVLTGTHGLVDDCLAVDEERPDIVAADLRALEHPYEIPVEEPDGGWTCMGSRVLWTKNDGFTVKHGINDTKNEGILRALIHATWEAVDNGESISRTEIEKVSREIA